MAVETPTKPYALPSLPTIDTTPSNDITQCDALVVSVGSPADGEKSPSLRPGTAKSLAQFGVDLDAWLASEPSFTGKVGATLSLALSAFDSESAADRPDQIVLVGVGDGTAFSHRRAGAAVARATRGRATVVATVVRGAAAPVVEAFAEGLILGGYSVAKRTSSSVESQKPSQFTLVGCKAENGVERAVIRAEGTALARYWANVPSDLKTPQWMADQARAISRQHRTTRITVISAGSLARQGFGGITAVGRGSMNEPCLVQLSYQPTDVARHAKHVVIVGKGITFDTGGISLKPRESMMTMKTDMTGSAVALATLHVAARLGVSHPVTILMPLAENMIGENSYRPGDVVTCYGGTTVEIVNTDAEGRMVLADALAYADETLDPDILIDVATLTGAATLSLGRSHAAMFTDDDALVRGLSSAGERAGENVWHMPLVADYRDTIDSTVADLCHISPGRSAGAITAALFLQHFSGNRRWAHLDIAGPGRATAQSHELVKGGTGFGVRLLAQWLHSLR